MKKRDLIRELRKIAKANDVELEFIREGGSHEIWKLGDVQFSIPRHSEINERTAQSTIKKLEEG